MVKESILPKLFISYCWSNSSHEQWVIDFATELRESGVDAILDKWDLKPGHDAIAFMEQMVTDSDIDKVVIVSNEEYAEKADKRKGGVGTETQIISKEIYDSQNQDKDKFVAVVVEKTVEGKPFLPTFYTSRIFIDLCDPEKYTDNFEKLLRWIYNKPLNIKPDLGSKPTFLDDPETIKLGTTSRYKRVKDAIINNKSYAKGAFRDYLAVLCDGFEKFRIDEKTETFDDQVIESINNYIPYRNELLDLFITICQYSIDEEYIEIIHDFFESIIPYMERPANINQWQEWDFDNYIYIVHELFLYFVTTMVKYKKYKLIDTFLDQGYYIDGNSDYGKNVIVDYRMIQKHMRSLETRNNRLKLNRISIRADLIKEKSIGTIFNFNDIMQADFILFIRAEIKDNGTWDTWWPETLVYLGHFHSSFEIFTRSTSKKYFDKIKCVLGISSKTRLEELLALYSAGEKRIPIFGHNSINPRALVGFDKLELQP